ncbi:hypothetical protein [Nocardia farcinica]|uniref:hypothetical protein n=1 Tax=Nocardia farcinica TaxID=37329 RepID=UPI0018936147|nr:hypothetical protein [Nocardia farcinica]MBF6234395.1 hypothetical protein [Nocardia farcinica]
MIVPPTLRGRQFAVVDVEGNGRTPPEIIEIAILPVFRDDVFVHEMLSWLIRPERPITPIVTRKVHGAMIRTCGSREGAPSRKMIDEVTGF